MLLFVSFLLFLMWSAIAFTCRYQQQYAQFQKEVSLLQKKGLFPPSIPLLVIDDPAPDLGSGGSTLNALLVVAESLSAKNGDTVLNNAVLIDANILIVHLGRQFVFDPCGAAFLDLPANYVTNSGCEITVSPLVHLYNSITNCFANGQKPGVWVCGCDALLWFDSDTEISWDFNADVTVLTTPVTPQRALGHGIYKLGQDSTVSDILYDCDLDELSAHCSASGSVPLVTALMHMSVPVAEAVLSLYSKHPLNASTYLGIDSGAFGLKLSLFFDFLLCTCASVTQEAFVSGARAGLKGVGGLSGTNGTAQVMRSARQAIWNVLRGFTTKAVSSPTKCNHYFTNSPKDFLNFMKLVELDVTPSHMKMSQSGGKVDLDFDLLSGSSATFALGTAEVPDLTSSIDASGKMSLLELDQLIDVASYFVQKRKRRFENICERIEHVLHTDGHECILPILQSSCLDGFGKELLLKLDQIACQSDNSRTVGRTLFCIADVLGLMALGHGGLRSGPAAHPDWVPAFRLLESNSLSEGISCLSCIRSKWMDSPTRLIRAARHYESAAQIFIRRTVMSVKQHICLESGSVSINDSGWHCASAAARIDVCGGWSDTPPITYEYGGAVLNIAIQVDRQKPIGARCRKTESPGIIIQIAGDENKIVFDKLDQIGCYSDPSAPGALICASMVCAGLINTENIEQTLEDQLENHFGAGFKGLELETWSNLPQGSGT